MQRVESRGPRSFLAYLVLVPSQLFSLLLVHSMSLHLVPPLVVSLEVISSPPFDGLKLSLLFHVTLLLVLSCEVWGALSARVIDSNR